MWLYNITHHIKYNKDDWCDLTWLLSDSSDSTLCTIFRLNYLGGQCPVIILFSVVNLLAFACIVLLNDQKKIAPII